MKKVVVMLVLVLVGVSQAAVLNTVDFTFGAGPGTIVDGGTGTNVTSVKVLPGAAFDLSVFATAPTFAATSAELLVGWGKATVRGTAAVNSGTAFTNRLGTVGFANPNPVFTVTTNSNVVGGAKGANGTQGSYGSHISMTYLAPGITMTTPTRLVDLQLINNMPAGQSAQIVFWRDAAPSSLGWNCYLGQTGNQSNEQAVSYITVNSVPEPISMILLAIGGLFISRRK